MALPPSELEKLWTGDAVAPLAWQLNPLLIAAAMHPFVGYQCPQVIMSGCPLKSHTGEV